MPTPQRTLTWLHLSDLHRCSPRDGGAGDVVLRRLIDDLESLRDAEGLRPDLLFMTGDLAFGQVPDQPLADQLREGWAWLEKVRGLYGLPVDDVFLVPGNHDVDRGKVKKKDQHWLRSLAETHDADEVRGLLSQAGDDWQDYMQRLACFEAFVAESCPHLVDDGGHCIYAATRRIAGLDVGVAGFNSAWSCGGDDDNGQLWLGEWQLDTLVAKLLDADVRIALVHHPFGWLVETEKAKLEARFQSEMEVLLHGHEHRQWVQTPQNDHLHVAAGAVLDRPDAELGYNLVRIDVETGEGEVWLRCLDQDTRKWKARTVPDRTDPRGIWPVRTGWKRPRETDRFAQLLEDLDETAVGLSVSSHPARHDDILSRVEAVCRLREGEEVHIERLESETGMSYLSVQRREGGIIRDYPVAATEEMTPETLDAFLRLLGRYQRLDPGGVSVLVCRQTPEEVLVRQAAQKRVRLTSFVEYQGLIDFRAFVENETRRLKADPIYNPKHYVPQKVRYQLSDQGHESDAVETITGWLEDIRGRFILVLGDFGTGKTFLLRELARCLGEGDGPLTPGPLTPVLIEMRNLEKGRTLDELAAQHFARSGLERLDFKAFRYMLRQGRIVLLFDGFDELALRVTYQRATEHFDTLVEAADGDAKIVVTSRTQHFESDKQISTALGDRVRQLAGHRIVHLCKFEETQIRLYLERRLGKPDAERRFELIQRIRDLMGLSQVPRMLGFISDLPEKDLLEAEGASGEVRAADLYQVLLDRWLGYETDRQNPKGATRVLSRDDRWAAVDQLALRLWERTERSLSVEDIAEEAATLEALAARRIKTDVATHQVGSGTLLVRDAEGAFSFVHQSVLEWLVARRAARELEEKGVSNILAMRTMSPLMAEFFRDLVGPEKAQRWMEEALAGDEVLKQNALVVRDRLEAIGFEVAKKLSLSGEDLQGRDFSGVTLDGSDLEGADLSDAKFVKTSLRGARLKGTRWIGADLSRAVLWDADLRDADLSRARLLGADLRGTDLRGSVLWRTKLVGAQLDGNALTGLKSSGSALSSQDFQVWHSRALLAVHSVAWHPSREILASGHIDGLVRLWDVGSGLEIRRLPGHQGCVLSVCFSADGTRLASGSDDRTVRLWDTASVQQTAKLEGHRGGVSSVCFSADGTRLASGSADRTVRLWDTASAKLTATLEGHQGYVLSVCFNADGTRLASGSVDQTVRLWDTATAQQTAKLEGHRSDVLSVCFSADGTRLASGSYDQTVRLWDTASVEQTAKLEGHRGGILSVCFSADTTRLASGSDDRTVRLWDTASAQQMAKLEGHQGGVSSVCFSADATRLASGSVDQTVRLWDTATAQQTAKLEGHQGGILSVCFSADATRLASGSVDQIVRLWDTTLAQQTVKLEGHQSEVSSVCFSPDGTRLASGSVDQTVRLWDTASVEQTAKLEGHRSGVSSVCFSADGTRLASGSYDQTVLLWDTVSARATAQLRGHQGYVLSVCFSADATRLASSSYDQTVRLWDTASAQQTAKLEGHQGYVSSVCFSADATRLASGSVDQTVRLWDTVSARPTAVLKGHQGIVSSVCFSPNGTRLASGSYDRTVRLWDTVSAQQTAKLEGHQGSVRSVCFSPDGARLASGSDDHTVRLWDVESGRCLAVLVAFPEGWVAYTPEGRYKLGGETAGHFWQTIGLCRFEPGELDPYVEEIVRVGDGEPLIVS